MLKVQTPLPMLMSDKTCLFVKLVFITKFVISFTDSVLLTFVPNTFSNKKIFES